MSRDSVLGPARVRRRLAALQEVPLNFDPEELLEASPQRGWRVDDASQALEAEPPGLPLPNGSWHVARRLMRGYEFADPSIAHAYYDPDVPLQGRTMLLRLTALGLVHILVGVRVHQVIDDVRSVDSRSVSVWGWSYRTLRGHIEQGEMWWEVWKWQDTGAVEFHVHSVWRPAQIANPFVRIGSWLLRDHERTHFIASTQRRMRTFVALALGSPDDPSGELRRAAQQITAHSVRDVEYANEELTRRARNG